MSSLPILETEAKATAARQEATQALLRAELLEAEAAAEKAAIAAEVARLCARSPLEVLQDEMVEMKRLLAARPAAPELAAPFKDSQEEIVALKEEMAALSRRASSQVSHLLIEIATLKEHMATLLRGRFIIRNSAPDGYAACALRGANASGGGVPATLEPREADACGATWPFHWTLERV